MQINTSNTSTKSLRKSPRALKQFRTKILCQLFQDTSQISVKPKQK